MLKLKNHLFTKVKTKLLHRVHFYDIYKNIFFLLQNRSNAVCVLLNV